MMQRIVLSLSLWLLAASSGLAAEFVATVDNALISAGKPFTLQLTLSGASPVSDPDFGPLQQAFAIVSETQSSNTTIINGAASSSLGWQLTLIPRQEGQLVVPAVGIQTAAGALRTKPIRIDVAHGAVPAAPQASAGKGMVSITAKAGTVTPYQNQSIGYTARVLVRGNISDMSLTDPSVSNAIVEQHGKPTIHDEIENGAAARVAEFHYIITPLQPGKMTIPPVIMEGKIETPDLAVTDPFGGGFSSALRQAMNFFSRFGGEPFKVASNPTVLDVKPPAAAMDPWLPLTSLKIIEDMDAAQSLRVGEPWTRKLTVLAEGAVGKQLPDLQAKQDHANFKVYADQPTTGEDIDPKSGAILGWRKESYSLIPLKAGRLTLPAVRVSWWDIVNNKRAIAELPERAVDVLPGAAPQIPPVIDATGRSQGVKPAPAAPRLQSRIPAFLTGSLFWVIVLAILAALLVASFLWRLTVRRKINRAETKSAAPKRRTLNPIADKTLRNARTAADLKSFWQEYAQEHWGVSRNTSLERIFSALSGSAPESSDIAAVIKGIGEELYAGKVADLEDLKQCSLRIIAASQKETGLRPKRPAKLIGLNPS